MPTKAPSEVAAEHLGSELPRHVKTLAAKLKSEIQLVGAQKLTSREMIDYAHRNWHDPQKRMALKQGMSPKDFLELVRQMVATHGDPMKQGGLNESTGMVPAGGAGGGGMGSYGPPAAPVTGPPPTGVPLPPYLPTPPTKWGG